MASSPHETYAEKAGWWGVGMKKRRNTGVFNVVLTVGGRGQEWPRGG